MKIITSIQPSLYPPEYERHEPKSSWDMINPFVTFPEANLRLYLEAFTKYVTPLLYFPSSRVVRSIFDTIDTNPHILPENMVGVCLVLAIGAQNCGFSHRSSGLLCFNTALADLQRDTPSLDCKCLETLALISLYTRKDRPQDSYLSLCTSECPGSCMIFNRLRRYRHRHWKARRS